MPRLIIASARRSSPSPGCTASAGPPPLRAGGPPRRRRPAGRRAAGPARAAAMAKEDLQASAPLRGHPPLDSFGPPRCPRQVNLRLPRRSTGQFIEGRHRGKLRIGRHRAGRERHQELVRRGALPVEDKAEPLIGQQAGGQLPVLRGLGVPDRLDRVPVLFVPSGGEPMQGGELIRLAAQELEPEEVSEHLVVAEPGPAGVQRDHECAGPLQLLQRSAPRRCRRSAGQPARR